MNQPTGKDVEFTVDGKPYVVQSGELAVIRSQKEEDRYLAQVSVSDTSIAITSPPLGLIVTFNSESVQVVVSAMYNNESCE